MRHTIEELAERADDRGDGYFFVLRHGKDDMPRAGRWQSTMRKGKGHGADTTDGYGETADEAVKNMLHQQEESDGS